MTQHHDGNERDESDAFDAQLSEALSRYSSVEDAAEQGQIIASFYTNLVAGGVEDPEAAAYITVSWVERMFVPVGDA